MSKIKIGDLKTGNCVSHNGKQILVGSIHYDKINIRVIDNKIDGIGVDSLEPVELTKTILYECLFTEICSNKVFIHNGTPHLQIHGDELNFQITWRNTVLDIEIKYLHQFQNAIKMLTGVDLKYNPSENNGITSEIIKNNFSQYESYILNKHNSMSFMSGITPNIMRTKSFKEMFGYELFMLPNDLYKVVIDGEITYFNL